MVDQTGEPIIGANVVVKGTTNGIITDLDGRFTLSNVPDKGTISISFIGYEESSSIAGNKFTSDITGSNAMLDEVVVVGYSIAEEEWRDPCYGPRRRRDPESNALSRMR